MKIYPAPIQNNLGFAMFSIFLRVLNTYHKFNRYPVLSNKLEYAWDSFKLGSWHSIGFRQFHLNSLLSEIRASKLSSLPLVKWGAHDIKTRICFLSSGNINMYCSTGQSISIETILTDLERDRTMFGQQRPIGQQQRVRSIGQQ